MSDSVMRIKQGPRAIATQIKTNLIVKKKRRVRPKEGDVFLCELVGGIVLLGRVASASIPLEDLGSTGLLLYFFKPGAKTLTVDALLTRPQLTTPNAFNFGHFEIIDRRPFEDGERYARHCFQTLWGFVDDHDVKVEAPFEPIVGLGPAPIPVMDDALSDALDIARANPPLVSGSPL